MACIMHGRPGTGMFISACSINLRIAAERTTKGSVQLIVQTAYAGVHEVFIGQLNKLNRICLKVFFC